MDTRLSSAPASIRRQFDDLLRSMRQRFLGKQLALAHFAQCTDAAVSYWESGKRAPSRRRFTLIVAAFAEAGAPHADLDDLRAAWESAKH